MEATLRTGYLDNLLPRAEDDPASGRPRQPPRASERVTHPYTFTIVEQHGWKVCQATITQQ